MDGIQMDKIHEIELTIPIHDIPTSQKHDWFSVAFSIYNHSITDQNSKF